MTNKTTHTAFTTTQATVTTTAAVIVAARRGRDSVTLQNHGTTDVFIGATDDVTTLTGFLLPGTKGASITVPATTDIYGIVGAGTQVISVLDTF
jgi:hypothetical protein